MGGEKPWSARNAERISYDPDIMPKQNLKELKQPPRRKIGRPEIVDEFTNIVGLVTLEMIVEHIVGEIEDEHDLIDSEREIIRLTETTLRLKGYCKINDLDLIIDSGFIDKSVETVGGYLIKHLNRIPVPGEILDFEKFQIEVIDSDSRKIKLLILKIK